MTNTRAYFLLAKENGNAVT